MNAVDDLVKEITRYWVNNLGADSHDLSVNDITELAKILIFNSLKGNPTVFPQDFDANCYSLDILNETILNKKYASIPANLLRQILVNLDIEHYTANHGVRISNAIITGRFDFDSLDIKVPLTFINCIFQCAPLLVDGKFRFLQFENCSLPRIRASRLTVLSSLLIRNCRIFGEVRLSGARIDGNLDLRSSKILVDPRTNNTHTERKPKPQERIYSIHAGGAKIHGNLLLHDHLITNRRIRITGAEIGRNVVLNDSEFGSLYYSQHPFGEHAPPKTDKELIAIDAEGIQLKGDLICTRGTRIRGQLNMMNARISGDVICRGAEFYAPYFYAISADGCYVKGALYFGASDQSKPCNIDGIVAFNQSRIDQGLYVTALDFSDSQVPDFRYWPKSIKREISSYFSASIYIQQECEIVASCNGFDLSYAKIQGKFQWSRVQLNPRTRLRLYNCYADIVDSDVEQRGDLLSWPYHGNLNLEGFSYNSIDQLSQARYLKVKSRQWHAHEQWSYPELWQGTSEYRAYGTGAISGHGQHWNYRVSALECWLSLHLPPPKGARIFSCVRDSYGKKHVPLTPQNRFTPQPYEEMAKLLRAHGHISRLADVIVEREKVRRKVSLPTDMSRREKLAARMRLAFNWLSGFLTGHGYKPWRIIKTLLVLWIATAWMADGIYGMDKFVPINPNVGEKVGFNGAIYALDTLVPIIDFQQTGYWTINSGYKYEESANIITNCMRTSFGSQFHNQASLSKECLAEAASYWMWFMTFVGWVMATIFITGFTPLVRKD